jgi:regulatory protein
MRDSTLIRDGTVRSAGTATRGPRERWPRAAVPPDPQGDREADPYSVARTIVLNQLTVSARTRSELRQKLASRNVPDDVAEAVLDRMEEVNLVDDEAFASEWVRSRHRGRGLARRALTAELRRKGVDDELARRAADELHPDTERATAEQLVARKVRSTRGLERDARVRRLAGMLARKGYPAGVAMDVVRSALAAEGEDTDDLYEG